MNDEEEVLKKYGDMIDLPHPDSKTHPRMSMVDRAAQFSPFAALTGHAAAVDEAARQAEERMEHDLERELITDDEV